MEESNEGSKNSDSKNASATPEAILTFGAWLQSHRTRSRISLEEIAAVTKVHIGQLKALEANEVSKLPAPAFVRGFLVSYARHLNMDENEVLDRYKTAFGGSLTPIADILTPTQNKSARSASAPKVAMVSSPHLKQAPSSKEIESNEKSSLNFKNIALTTGVIGLLLLVGTLIALGKKEKNEGVNQNSLQSSIETPASTPAADAAVGTAPATGTSAATTAPSSATAAPTTPPTPTPQTPAQQNADANLSARMNNPNAPVTETAAVPKKYQLEIKAIDANYVHLRLDENSPKGITLKAAQSQTFDVAKKAILTISDAGNLEVRWNNVWYSSLGYRGDLKVITLPDQLSALTPKGSAPPKAPKPKAKVVDAAAAPAAAAGAAPATPATPPPAADSRE